MNKEEQPVYQQLIQSVKRGFSVLDSTIQNEIVGFIKSQQKPNGGFVDRSGNPDPYYSLFGHWLCLATDMREQDNLLKHYINKFEGTKTRNIINQLAVFLISLDLLPEKKKTSFFTILKKHFKNRQTIDSAYHFFLLTLVFDASNKHKRLYFFIAKIWLLFYTPVNNIPCSLLSALIFTRRKLGLKYENLRNKLITYNHEQGGFKAFKSLKSSDMLSTGIALFVLEKTAYDLRMIKPGCLNFVEQHYYSGSFLSGDGDITKDLEYTFYGLLAIGSLSDYEKQT